ncbi:MAG TPA: DUF4199 domain-containing protein [Puia sp.]|nr:DUF4199 domain-containing protein [Puia sp.]
MRAKKISIPLLFGLIATGIMILFILGSWLAGPKAFAERPVWLSNSIVILIGAIAAAVEKRAKGGILDFRSALRVAFGVMVLALIAQCLFTWLIPTVIDPHFNQRMVPVMLENYERDYHKFGVPEDQIQPGLDDIRTHNQYSLGRVILWTAPQLLMLGIIAILIAATVRSKKGPTSTPPTSPTPPSSTPPTAPTTPSSTPPPPPTVHPTAPPTPKPES